VCVCVIKGMGKGTGARLKRAAALPSGSSPSIYYFFAFYCCPPLLSSSDTQEWTFVFQ
jgi:hypothetical protein